MLVKAKALQVLFALAALVGGCSKDHGERHMQSALEPAGTQAERIHKLLMLYFWVCVVVCAAVMVFILIGALRNRKSSDVASDNPDVEPDQSKEKSAGTIVGASLVATVVILIVLFAADLVTGRGIHGFANTNDFLLVRVIGHQWWWEVQ